MRTSRITGRAELLDKLAALLSSRVLAADIEQGETLRRLPDGSSQPRLNGSATLRITIAGGAKDD